MQAIPQSKTVSALTDYRLLITDYCPPQNGVYPLRAENGRLRRPLCCSLRTAATTRSSIASEAASSHFSASGLPRAQAAPAAVPYAKASCALRISTGDVASVKSGYAFKYRKRICVSCVAPKNHNPSARHSHTLNTTSCTREGSPPCRVKSTISSNSCVDKFGRSQSFNGTSRSVGSWFGGAVASLIETCSEASCPATAATTNRASSWINPPPPEFPIARCTLRYAEFRNGSSTQYVNKFTTASFSIDLPRFDI